MEAFHLDMCLSPGGWGGVTPLCGVTGTCRNLEYAFDIQSPGFLGPLLNVTDIFRIFEIYNLKIQIKNLHKLQAREY